MMLKKITIYIVRAMLCQKKLKAYLLIALLLCLFAGQLNAQESKAVDVTLKGIQIGQNVPDITITNLHNYKNANGKVATTAKLSDFKGKLLILDFWATWCAPCVAMIPRMDSLQKEFGNKVQFLSVTYQGEKEVIPFLEKFEKRAGKHFDLPVLTGEKLLHQMFPHLFLPHYVWIDQYGVLRAFTGMDEVNSDNLRNGLVGSFGLVSKIDEPIKYDVHKFLYEQPILNFKKHAMVFSAKTGYIKGIKGRFATKLDDKQMGFQALYTNLPMLRLFSLAYANRGKFLNKRFALEVQDKNAFLFPVNQREKPKWDSTYKFSYELSVGVGLDYTREDFFRFMQDDMARYFPKYQISIETRTVKCLALQQLAGFIVSLEKNPDPTSVFREISANGFVGRHIFARNLIDPLSDYYLQDYHLPVVDNTNNIGPLNMSFAANMSDVTSINLALKKYGLELKEAELPIEILVIKDKLANFSLN